MNRRVSLLTEDKKAIKFRDMRRLAEYRDYLRSHPRLTYLFAELTDRCNLSCLHCGSSCGDGKGRNLDTELLLRALTEVSQDFEPRTVMICLTGGEPLLHPDFFAIAESIHSLGFPWGITTNGTLIDSACAEKMLEYGDKVVLGCRDFDQPGVPPRSVAGNKTTSRLFRLFYGIRITDTQTGLRAIPQRFLDAFCAMEGERFEYETNMLLQMKRQRIVFLEQPIATVYDPEDYSSHYNAVKDSLRILKIMLKNGRG